MFSRRLPLHIKISSLSCIFLLLFSAFILISTDNIINDKLTQQLTQDTRQVIKAINEKAEFIILFESESHIRELHNTFESFDYIINSIITDSNNMVISTFSNKKIKKNKKNITVKSPIFQTEELGVFEPTSTQKKPIGHIIIRVSTHRLEQIQHSILKNISTLCIIFIILSATAYFFMTKKTLKPLHNIIKIMQTFVSNSTFTSKAPIGSTKEIAEIALAYNQMMNHIELVTDNLDQSNQSLTQEIKEKERSFKTQQKLEEQLSQAQKLEAIGRMTAAIAHDFNNILGGILGFSTLALEEIDEMQSTPQHFQNYNFDDLKDSLHEIHLGGERAQGIIRQLLASSRKANSKPSLLNIHDAIQSLYPLLKTSVTVNITIEVSICPDELILIDPTHFEQMILNLVINARDSIEQEGRIKITSSRIPPTTLNCISCHEDIAFNNQDLVQISIVDSGSGIEPADLAQIFDPFFSTKDKHKGTGMGLSIIHGLAHKNNGHIRVESSLYNGTAFSLIFPIATKESSEKNNSNRKPDNTVESSSSARSSKNIDKRPIMLIDDNQQLLKFMRLFLTQNGYTVEAFESPTKALTTFIQNNGEYSLIISDYIMPKLSGADLCRAILKFKPSTHIIICSGYNEDLHNDKNTIQDVIYMTKPVEQELLLRHINQFNTLK